MLHCDRINIFKSRLELLLFLKVIVNNTRVASAITFLSLLMKCKMMALVILNKSKLLLLSLLTRGVSPMLLSVGVKQPLNPRTIPYKIGLCLMYNL